MISPLPFAPLVTFLREVVRNGVSLRRLHVLALMGFRYAVFEPLRLAERVWLDDVLESQRLQRDPIFVLGHWRSGTSHLQTLLGQDPDFTTSTLYRCLFSDVSGVSESWLKPVLNRIARLLRIPYSFQREPLDLDTPAEGDMGLLCQLSPCSYTWGHIFPGRFAEWFERWVLKLDDQTTKAWLDEYDRFIRKIAYADGGRRVVMKSPGDTARVKALAAHYPDARFVYIHRDPVEVFHSSRYFWNVIRREYSLQTLSDAQIDELIFETYPRLLGAYAEQRADIEPGRLVEVSHADLRDHPAMVLKQIYEHLDLGTVPPGVLEGLSDSAGYRQQKYETTPALNARIGREWKVGYADWTPRSGRGETTLRASVALEDGAPASQERS